MNYWCCQLEVLKYPERAIFHLHCTAVINAPSNLGYRVTQIHWKFCNRVSLAFQCAAGDTIISYKIRSVLKTPIRSRDFPWAFKLRIRFQMTFMPRQSVNCIASGMP